MASFFHDAISSWSRKLASDVSRLANRNASRSPRLPLHFQPTRAVPADVTLLVTSMRPICRSLRCDIASIDAAAVWTAPPVIRSTCTRTTHGPSAGRSAHEPDTGSSIWKDRRSPLLKPTAGSAACVTEGRCSFDPELDPEHPAGSRLLGRFFSPRGACPMTASRDCQHP